MLAGGGRADACMRALPGVVIIRDAMVKRSQRALEWAPGAVNAAAAGNEFVREAKRALPKEAIDELLALPSDDGVADWCSRWHVDAPRFHEEAQTLRLMAQHMGLDGAPWVESERWIAAPVPDDWLTELVRLNSLRPLETLLEDGVPAVASEREVVKQREKLDYLPVVITRTPRLYIEFTDRCESEPDGVEGILAEIRARPGIAEEIARRKREFIEQGRELVRQSRAEALKSDKILAPIGADPLRESKEHFEARAQAHWAARVAHASALGHVPVSPRPALHQHLDWLVRYQVKGEGFSEIARTAGSVSSPQAVALAVRSLAELIGLTLRTSIRGGARPRRARRSQRKK